MICLDSVFGGMGGKEVHLWISCVGGLGGSDWVFVTWTPHFGGGGLLVQKR